MTPTERPLLSAGEAGRLIWPDLTERVVQRRVYRWCAEHVIPEAVILRAGRSLYFRRVAFLAWLEHGAGNGADDR